MQNFFSIDDIVNNQEIQEYMNITNEFNNENMVQMEQENETLQNIDENNVDSINNTINESEQEVKEISNNQNYKLIDENEIILTKEAFSKFNDIISNLLISDIDLKSGILRYSYENILIVYCDLSDIIPWNISLSKIKQKINLFKLLLLDETDIHIKRKNNELLFLNEKDFVFSFKELDSKYLENKFIEDDKYKDNIEVYLTEESCIADVDLSLNDIEKINKIISIFQLSDFNIKIDSKYVTTKLETISKQEKSVIKFINKVNSLESKYIITLRGIPFENLASFKQDINIKIYNKDDKSCLVKYEINDPKMSIVINSSIVKKS